MWQIVAYVRSLSRVSGPVDGDPRAGRQVYERAACERCHWIDGNGGRLGPELTAVGWRRSATHLRASLLDPNDDIDAAYRQVTVQPRGGEAVRGILRNEDSFSIQLIDSREELRSFAKTDLTGIDRSGGSLMPALTGRFGDDEVTNLVAYLASLRPE
jgi:putative heme-binding domain-containing protein